MQTTLTDYERHLSEQVAILREQVRVISTRPMPDLSDPGYVVFQALMEDARERGEVRLRVRETTLLQVEWEDA